MSLANRYRPKDFSEVVGQEFVVRVLARALDKKEIPQALLFAGPRGIGKTTLARLFAKGLNCELGPTSKPCNSCKFCMDFNEGKATDIIEIDAASNRGIENVREIQKDARFLPSSRYKVYIIDEAHMLTNEAFNSLLKILEEPPKHVVFILATTEPNKIPATILSRLQKFNLKPHPKHAIIQRLKHVCKLEGIYATEEALSMIAERAEGSMRDALILLEQASIFSDKNVDEFYVSKMLGVVPRERFSNLLEYIIRGDFKGAMQSVEEILGEFSPQEFAGGFVKFLENLLLEKTENLSFEEKTILLRMALDMEFHVRDTFSPRSWITYDIARMCSFKRVVNIDEISSLLGVQKAEEVKKTNVITEDPPIDILRRNFPGLSAYLESSRYEIVNGSLKIYVGDKVIKEKLENGSEILKEVFKVEGVEVILERLENEEMEKKIRDIFSQIKRDWEETQP